VCENWARPVLRAVLNFWWVYCAYIVGHNKTYPGHSTGLISDEAMKNYNTDKILYTIEKKTKILKFYFRAPYAKRRLSRAMKNIITPTARLELGKFNFRQN
jgi:hypothetical protein